MYRPAHARPSTLFTARLRRAATVGVALASTVGGSFVVADPASAHTVSRATSSTSTTSAGTSVTGSRIVAEASRHIGKPYVYGAVGPNRFDCSGYTKYVFARFGKALPHNSAAQVGSTVRVARSAKKQGDLIFMRSSSGRVTHVGIYAGANRWLVAPKTGDRVKLQTLYSQRYTVGRVR